MKRRGITYQFIVVLLLVAFFNVVWYLFDYMYGFISNFQQTNYPNIFDPTLVAIISMIMQWAPAIALVGLVIGMVIHSSLKSGNPFES